MRLLDLSNTSHDAASQTAAPTPEEAAAHCKAMREKVWEELAEVVSPQFYAALLEQRARHEAVAEGRPFAGQAYLIWSLSGGVGNRFLSMASTFVAAMLSQRVFLMKDWFTKLPPQGAKQIPVVHTSPRTNEYNLEDLAKLFSKEELAKRPPNEALLCPLLPMMSLTEFYRKYPQEFLSSGTLSPHPEHAKVDISHRHDKTLKRWNRILCSNFSNRGDRDDVGSGGRRMAAPGKVGAYFFPEKFVYIWTNQYYLPALFANPIHGEQLREWFPSGGPYGALLRVIAIPSLVVMRRVHHFLRVNHFVPRSYDALHIRSFLPTAMASMARAFSRCIDEHAQSTLKMDLSLEPTSAQPRAAAPVKPFFLASFHPEVRDYFKGKYGANRTRIQAAPPFIQNTGNLDSDREALADLLLLASAETLFVSPKSTFGVFAAALGNRLPVQVVYYRSTDTCHRVKSNQPAFGSWFRYDSLGHKGATAPNSLIHCKLLPIPPDIMNPDA